MPEQKDEPVRIGVARADRLRGEIARIAADLGHRRAAFEPESVLALDDERDRRLPHVVERECRVEEAQEGADRATRVLVLRLAEQERRAPLEIAQIDVVGERRADDRAAGGDRERDLGLGIVPERGLVEAGVVARSDRRHRLALGEHLGVGADADFQILRPGAGLDQRILEPHRRGRARLAACSRSSPSTLHDLLARLRRAFAAAARALLDHALEQRLREGDARRLDRLQIDGREQARAARAAAVARRVGENIARARRCADLPPRAAPRPARAFRKGRAWSETRR